MTKGKGNVKTTAALRTPGRPRKADNVAKSAKVASKGTKAASKPTERKRVAATGASRTARQQRTGAARKAAPGIFDAEPRSIVDDFEPTRADRVYALVILAGAIVLFGMIGYVFGRLIS